MLNLSESEMLALIKLCNLPKTGLKFGRKVRKINICIIGWKADNFRLYNITQP